LGESPPITSMHMLKIPDFNYHLGISPTNITLVERRPKIRDDGIVEPFIIKSHILYRRVKILRKQLEERFVITTHLFTSSHVGEARLEESLHNQGLQNMYDCSLCEIDSYVPIFGLSKKDVKLLKEYMEYYETIRQCCGLQQSKYNRYRLHGCNVTQLFIDKPDIHYPYCERHDLPKLEKEFSSLPIKHHFWYPEFNWMEPGDCAKFDQQIIDGMDFHEKNFTTCEKMLEDGFK